MAFGFPISLEVTGRRCVVFGSGAVARARAEALLEAGASVTLIARPHEDGDLCDVFLAVAASGDPEENARIFAEAERERVLLNAVDDPTRCHFAVPSVLRRGDLRIAVSTGGRAPGYAKRLREELESVIGPEYGEMVQRMGEARDRRRAPRAEDHSKEAVA